MRFSEAMRLLEEGKKVRNITDPEGYYLVKILDKVILNANKTSYDKSNSPLGELILSEWEEYEEPERLLSFAEVVKGMKEGKRFRRQKWPKDYALVNVSGGLLMHPDYTICIPTIEAIEANDWIEVK